MIAVGKGVQRAPHTHTQRKRKVGEKKNINQHGRKHSGSRYKFCCCYVGTTTPTIAHYTCTWQRRKKLSPLSTNVLPTSKKIEVSSQVSPLNHTSRCRTRRYEKRGLQKCRRLLTRTNSAPPPPAPAPPPPRPFLTSCTIAHLHPLSCSQREIFAQKSPFFNREQCNICCCIH